MYDMTNSEKVVRVLSSMRTSLNEVVFALDGIAALFNGEDVDENVRTISHASERIYMARASIQSAVESLNEAIDKIGDEARRSV